MTTDATLEMIMGMGFPIGIPILIGNPMGIAWRLVTKLGMGMERNGPCEKKSFPIISTQHCSISKLVYGRLKSVFSLARTANWRYECCSVQTFGAATQNAVSVRVHGTVRETRSIGGPRRPRRHLAL